MPAFAPLVAGLSRLTVAGAGGWFAYYLTQDIGAVFAALALALVVFGTVMGGALKLGAWGTAPPERRA